MKFTSRLTRLMKLACRKSPKAIRSKLCQVLGAFVLGAVVGAAFMCHVRNSQKDTITTVHNLDYFISDQSFSEVQNAKGVLAGLSRQFLTEVRSKCWLESQENPSVSDHPLKSSASLISALEHGVEEFKGTEYELELTKDLLRALKSEQLNDRWLQLYLTTLYKHPTDEIVLTFAHDAIQMGTRLGRQENVLKAFRHVCSIPMEFPCKKELQAAEIQLSAHPAVAKNEHLPKSLLVVIGLENRPVLD